MDAPVVDADYLMEIEKARRDLHALIFMDNRRAPLMLRLAWYDAATYDANTKTGGPNGSVRYYTEELKLDANKGLKSAVDLCVDIKTKLKKITYADLYQLAGIVAVEATGGPAIDFVSGRKDSLESPTKGRLPDPATRGAGYLRDVCNRMGLSDKDFVALSGSITWAYEEDKSKSESQPRTTYPLKFDYSYFPKLLKGDDSKGLLKLPMDKFLVEDPKFRRHVELYSNDEDAFFRDYAAAHKKFSELGLKRRTHDQCLWEELLLLGCCFE